MAADRGHDVGCGQGDVLDARAPVGLEVFLDLALPQAGCRLVDGHHDAGAVVHDGRTQGRVLGRDLVGVEMTHLREPEDLDVPIDPFVESALLDVADHVVDGRQPDPVTGRSRRQPVGGEAGPPSAIAARPLHEEVPGLAVGRDGGGRDRSGVVAERGTGSATTVAPLAAASVAVAAASSTLQARWRMPSPWSRTWRATSLSGPKPGRDDEPDGSLGQHVGNPVGHAGLGAGVGHHLEPESRGEPGGDRPGVSDPPLEVVPAEQLRGDGRSLVRSSSSVPCIQKYRQRGSKVNISPL